MKKGKPLFLSFLFTIITIISISMLNLYAAFERNIPVTVVQPDGTVLNLFASGDEYYSRLHDIEDYTIIRDPKSGYYVYAAGNKGELIPSNFIVKPGIQSRPNVTPGLIPSPKKIKLPSLSNTDASTVIPGTPKTRIIENVVVFIRFSDEKEFTTPVSFYENLFNTLEDAKGEVGSMRNYFKEASYGKLDITTSFHPAPGHTVKSFQASHPRNYYKPYNAVTNRDGYLEDGENNEKLSREVSLIHDALNAVRSSIRADAILDSDNDGYVDHVSFVISGDPVAGSSLLWPHHGNLESNDIFIHNKKVSSYDIHFEGSLEVYGAGELAHEMLHGMGVPDLYHFYRDGRDLVGEWDIMGEWPKYTPQQLSSYMKYRYTGWLDSIPEITGPGTYTLNPLHIGSGNCLKMVDGSDPYSFYVLEYREKGGIFDNSMPGSGLIVYKIRKDWDGIGNGMADPGEVSVYGTVLFSMDGKALGGQSLPGLKIANVNISNSVLLFTIMPSTSATTPGGDATPELSDTKAIKLTMGSSPVSASITVSPADDNGLSSGDTYFERIYTLQPSALVTLTAPYKSNGYTYKYYILNSTVYYPRTLSLLMSSSKSVIFYYHIPLAEAVDNTSLDFTTGGSRDWYTDTGTYYYGSNAARTGPISGSQSTYMQTTVTGPATIKFYWKVSSEEGYDFLKFYLDNVEQYSICGDVAWQQKTVTIPSGNHTIKWAYSKDAVDDVDSDCGWVDKVEYITDLSITVTSPNGGESWESGTRKNITFNYTNNFNDSFKLSLWKDEEKIGDIVTVGWGTKSYSWLVGSYNNETSFVQPGTGYQIRVQMANGAIRDMSDNSFTIASSTINLTSPNGGEKLGRKVTWPITWTDTGNADTVSLSIYQNGSKLGDIATGIPSTDLSYPWVVGVYSGGTLLSTGSNYTIRISKDSEIAMDVSDSSFAIVDQAITITTPSAGSTYSDTFSIAWKSDDDPNGAFNIELWQYGSKIGDIATSLYYIPQATYNYSWNLKIGDVRVPSGSGYQIRIVEPYTGVSGFSDVFSIRDRCAITFTSPVGGESLPLNSTHTITWTVENPSSTYNIQLLKGGSTVSDIVRDLPMETTSYTWTVGSHLGGTAAPGTGYSLYIYGCNFVISNTFTIAAEQPASITVTSPNGGENWPTGQTLPITWTSTGSIANVKIEYSTDSGSNWTTIIASTSNTGSYSWTIPETTSTTCLVKVSNAVNTAVNDSSDAVFTLTDSPTILVTSPNGGETLRSGSTHTVTWISSRLTDSINISLWKDGSKVGDIATAVPNSVNTFDWTVGDYIGGTATAGKGYTIVVSENNTGETDSSNAYFFLVNPVITITSPNGGETWKKGTSRDITWTSSNLAGTLAISLWKDGAKVGDIASGISRVASFYTWVVGAYDGGTTDGGSGYTIKIEESNSNASDSSDSSFTITQPTITVLSPNGGENWRLARKHTITWTSSGVTEPLTISIWKDGVKVGNILSKIPASMNSYIWNTNTLESGSLVIASGYTIRIDEDHTGVTDSSDTPFSIVSSQPLKLTSPNGGEVWRSGTFQTITWEEPEIFYGISIALMKDGSEYRTIASNVSSYTTSYLWDVGATESGLVISSGDFSIRIKENYTSNEDTSDAPFTYLVSNITVSSPIFNDTWRAGETRDITWKCYNVVDTLTISLWKDNVKLGNIATGLPNTQTSYAWPVGTYIGGMASTGSDYRIVVSQDNSTIASDFDNPFTIIVPMITVTAPNGGEFWNPGLTKSITWTSTSLSNPITISLWKDGSKVGDIATGLANTLASYSWVVGNYIGGTASEGSGYSIKISEATVGTSDSSDSSFLIKTPSIAVTSPNGGENWRTGDSKNITWSSEGLTGTLTITLLKQGTRVGNIVTGLANTVNSYTWTVGSYVGGTALEGWGYQIKVEDSGTTVSDLSDSTFSIIPATVITVLTPNGGETLPIGYSTNITWKNPGVTGLQKITLWKDGSLVGVIADDILPTKRTYTWTLAGKYEGGLAAAGTGYTIKVEEVGTSYSDTSDASFTLTDTPPASQLTLKSPNGGESWLVGKGAQITWDTTGTIANVKLEYSTNNGSSWTSITNSIRNTGSYLWLIPNAVSANCRVRVSDASNAAVTDSSDSVFSIVNTKSIAMVSPNGGETWTRGTSYSITWTASGCMNPFKITLWKNGVYVDTIAQSVSQTSRSYTWKAGELFNARPLVAGTGFQVKIEVQEKGGISDMSNAVFTIN